MITLEKLLNELTAESLNEIVGGKKSKRHSGHRSTHKRKTKKSSMSTMTHSTSTDTGGGGCGC